MKLLKSIAIVLLSVVSLHAHAQMMKDESKWTFEAKKKAGNQYEIIAHLKLPKGWHVYAMKPGGDGTLIPVSFTFNKNAAVKLTGAVKEKGKIVSEKVEGMDGKINMYLGTVDYTQLATVTGATTITGSYEYQMCNDRMCLPPTTKQFKIAVK